MNKLQEMGLINEYTVTWCIYLLACVGIFIVVWRISRDWPVFLRQALRFVVACVVLVPVAVETGKEAMAPAFIVAIFEGATGNSDGLASALAALALAAVLALLVYGAWLSGKYFYRKKQASKTMRPAAPRSAERPSVSA